MLSEIDRFVNWVRMRSPEAHTWQDYCCDLRFFLEAVGDRPPNTITFQDIDRFILAQSEKGFKPATINRRLASIAALYAFLMPEDDELACPVFPRRHHLREPQRLPRPVQEDALREFFAMIDNVRDLAMFTLMLRCGLRISEIAKLELSDLYLEEETPRMLARGKGSRQRVAYLSDQAVRGEGSSDHVFLYRHAPLSKDLIRSRLKTIGTRNGVRVYPHRLRHTCASQLLKAGCRITSIQAFLGHKRLNTTMIYARAYDQTVADDYFAAMSRVEERMEIGLAPKPTEDTNQEYEVVKDLKKTQIVTWLEPLALPELCHEERLEIVEHLKYALSLTLNRQHAPPVTPVAVA